RPAGLPATRKLYREFQEALDAATTDREREALQVKNERLRVEANERVRQFYATEEGRNYRFSHRLFALDVSPDGSFRIEDVPGGAYQLNVRLGDPGEKASSGSNGLVLIREVEVPDSPGGRVDEPHDLGVIELDVAPL